MQKSNAKSTGKSASRNAPVVPEKTVQQKAFDNAMELFHARDFSKAKQQFNAALEGSSKELSYAAKQHLLMCEKRLAKSTVKLDSADDYYNYGISLYNQRNLDAAKQSFEKALKLEDADHIHYALALALGHGQDIEGAVKHLGRAIELQNRNKNAALNDPDFQELLQHAPIKELIVGSSNPS